MHLTCACDYACVCIMQIQFGFELELFFESTARLITPLSVPPCNPSASYSQPWLQISELLTVAKSCFFTYWQTQPLVSRRVGLHATGFKSLFLKNKILVIQQNRGWTRPYIRSLLGLAYTGSCLSPWALGTRRLLGVLTGLLSKTVLERMLGHRQSTYPGRRSFLGIWTVFCLEFGKLELPLDLTKMGRILPPRRWCRFLTLALAGH